MRKIFSYIHVQGYAILPSNSITEKLYVSKISYFKSFVYE